MYFFKFCSIGLYTLLFVIVAFNSFGQNLESIGKEKPLKISGSASANQILYLTNGQTYGRLPYTYVLSGNLNFDLYGLSIPLYYTLSNQSSSFRQPFNQLGLHPTYKWVTLHAGYNSMVFTPYSLNGHIFSGAGVDLAPPGIFRFSAMYGRLQKAVQPDTVNNSTDNPAFKRFGYGFKAGLAKDKNFIYLVLFKAKDELNSIKYVPEEQGILPEENLVLGVNAGKSLGKRILFNVEYASSAITKDLRAEKSGEEQPFIYSLTNNLFTTRYSTSYYNAVKSGLSYNAKTFTIGLNYERIDPGYRTLGAYYFNNDLENYTVNGLTRLFKDKINLAVNVGTQRNNLDNNNVSEMKRFLGSVNVGFVPTQSLNLNMSYSNFQTYTNIRSQFDRINQLTPYDNLDTLNFVQVTQSATFNGSYRFGKTNKQVLNAFLSYNQSKENQEISNSDTYFYNSNIAYNYNVKTLKLGFTSSLNATYSEIGSIAALTVGPVLGVNKEFFNSKLKNNLSFAFNRSFNQGELISNVMNVRLTGVYKIEKRHHLNLSMVYLNREVKTTGNSSNEFTANLGYIFNF
ncbi:MAG: hypothetical protein K2X86_06475 [Cytophagaceae bacterium]|nr:hypothetical protein [Cytophagaceae bacterium]